MEYDGIEVRPVSALSSSTYVRIWAEVQDMTGDRLRADMDIDGYVADVPTLGVSQFSLPQVISYDEETHTALIEFSSTGYGVTENVPVSICFDRFQPRQKISDVSVPIELVTAQTLASTTAPDGSVVLVPEQTPVALEDVYKRQGMVCIVEIMGRHAGWLAGAAGLATAMGAGPDLVYLPETDFDMKKFLADVKRIYEEKGNCLVAVSEGDVYKRQCQYSAASSSKRSSKASHQTYSR